MTVALCFVCTCAGEVLGTLILAYVGVRFFGKALFDKVNARIAAVQFCLKVLERADEDLTSV
jgi:hypothetical protein